MTMHLTISGYLPQGSKNTLADMLATKILHLTNNLYNTNFDISNKITYPLSAWLFPWRVCCLEDYYLFTQSSFELDLYLILLFV
jgi:hypothetical protein